VKHLHVFKNIMVMSSIAISAQMAQALISDKGSNRVEIQMSNVDLNHILSSEKSESDEATVRIFKDGQLVQEARIGVQNRGQTSLREFARKNLSIKIDKSDLNDNEHVKKLKIGEVKSKKLILSAGPEDTLLIKNQIGYALLKKIGLTSLENDYAELLLNGKSYGLYMVTDNPGDYMIKEKEADVVFRRRYNDDIELKDAKKSLSDSDILEAQQQLTRIHKKITKLTGQRFIEEISAQLNLKNYMKWMALNYILKNGDYVDEVYFYGKKQAHGQMYFDISPWDLDDTFSDKMHLAQVPTFPNNSMQEESAKQLIYNYEGRIDLAIARDPVLLEMYFQNMEEVVQQLSKDVVDAEFAKISDKVAVYMMDRDVQKNGQLDVSKQSNEPFVILEDLNAKKNFINARIQSIKSELEKIKMESPENRKLRLNAFQLFFIKMNNALLRYFTK